MEPCHWSERRHNSVGVSLRERGATLQVMLAVSLRARWDATLVRDNTIREPHSYHSSATYFTDSVFQVGLVFLSISRRWLACRNRPSSKRASTDSSPLGPDSESISLFATVVLDSHGTTNPLIALLFVSFNLHLTICEAGLHRFAIYQFPGPRSTI